MAGQMQGLALGGHDEGAELRRQIRQLRSSARRRLVVIDDDLGGTQSVHDVEVVTSTDRADLVAGLEASGACCFFLTNSRNGTEADAVRACLRLARTLRSVSSELGVEVELVLRTDSTLRGHGVAAALAVGSAGRRQAGEDKAVILFAPAFIDAGRVTFGDVHHARVGGSFVPVGQTEFAHDRLFGYRSSDLKEYLVERSAGAITPASIASLGLEEVRSGALKVANRLLGLEPGSFVVVNAVEQSDLEQVALGVAMAQRSGRRFLHLAGPSFVRALCGIDPIPPVRPRAAAHRQGGHGLVVAGSHVALTSAQLATARHEREAVPIELDVDALLGGAPPANLIAQCAAEVRHHLAASTVLLFTSRRPVLGTTVAANLAIGRAVSDALVRIVQRAREAKPAWVMAKGGVTSHDLAIRGLGIRRALLRGQLLPGLVPIFEPQVAPAEVLGMDYVVFPGNVGDEHTLAEVMALLDGPERG